MPFDGLAVTIRAGTCNALAEGACGAPHADSAHWRPFLGLQQCCRLLLGSLESSCLRELQTPLAPPQHPWGAPLCPIHIQDHIALSW